MAKKVLTRKGVYGILSERSGTAPEKAGRRTRERVRGRKNLENDTERMEKRQLILK